MITLALPAPPPRAVRTLRLATLGSTVSATRDHRAGVGVEGLVVGHGTYSGAQPDADMPVFARGVTPPVGAG